MPFQGQQAAHQKAKAKSKPQGPAPFNAPQGANYQSLRGRTQQLAAKSQQQSKMAKRAFMEGFFEIIKRAYAAIGEGEVGRSGAERDLSQMHNQNSDVPIAKEPPPHQASMGAPQMGTAMPSPPAMTPAGNKQVSKPQLGYKNEA